MLFTLRRRSCLVHVVSCSPRMSSAGAPPPPKKKKIACKYRAEWSRYHMRPSDKGATYAQCTLCKTDICIAGGGQHEVDRHCKTAKHKELLCQLKHQPKVTTVLAKAASTKTVQDQVVVAEIYFAKFVAEHNLAFLAADHFTHLVKVMFPDSKIAEAYSSARTKTTAIITHALAPSCREAVDKACGSSSFTILCDGGNDQVDRKYFAILVRFWDEEKRRAVTRFLDMPVCNIATAEKLF